MTMTPQPYPFWCAEASREHGVIVSRVIGWIENPDTEDGNVPVIPLPVAADYLPILVTADRKDGTFGGIGAPIEYQQLFFGDDPVELRRQANAWLLVQGVELPPTDHPEYGLDSAMHSVWLHGDWRWLTQKMTSEEREAAAAAVERYHAVLDATDPDPMGPLDPSGLRWWNY